MSCERGDYGAVLVIAGRHKGKVGQYDDDAGEKTAIVYFGTPLLTPYELIQRRCLERIVLPHQPTEDLRKEDPGLVAMLHIPEPEQEKPH